MSPSAPAGAIVCCVKWVDSFVEVDPLTGVPHADDQGRGFSAADEAALEVGLGLADAWGVPVVAITAGAADASAGLEQALAVGANRGLLLAGLDPGAPSLEVAHGLAWALREVELTDALVLCGDYSADRGSGSVPAALAALTGRPQALGLVGLTEERGRLRLHRRLDGARREELLADPPAVLSLEGSVARLRRAPLAAALSVRATSVERLGPPPAVATPWGSTAEWQPPVPRTKVQPPPEGADALARVAELTGSLAGAASTQALAVSPEEASRHILAAWERSGGRVPDGAPAAPVAGAAIDHDQR